MDKVKKHERKNWFYSYNMIFELNVSVYAKIVYQFLCRCADDEGSSFPKNETVAKACGIGVTKAKEAIKELIGAKLLSKKARYVKTENDKMKQTSNEYIISVIILSRFMYRIFIQELADKLGYSTFGYIHLNRQGSKVYSGIISYCRKSMNL